MQMVCITNCPNVCLETLCDFDEDKSDKKISSIIQKETSAISENS